MDKVLRSKDLKIGYDKPLSSSIDISISSGELVAIIGINGIGKSTLIKTFSGDIPALGGEVFIQEKPITSYKPKELAIYRSIVFTNPIASKYLTVRELLSISRYINTTWNNKLGIDDYDKIEQALRLTHTTLLVDKKCNELSDGLLQRVMLAQAFVQDTPLVFFDEPTSFLDIYQKIEILKLLKEMTKKHKKTIIFSSHEIEICFQIADKILFLNVENYIFDSVKNIINSEIFNQFCEENKLHFDSKIKRFKYNLKV